MRPIINPYHDPTGEPKPVMPNAKPVIPTPTGDLSVRTHKMLVYSCFVGILGIFIFGLVAILLEQGRGIDQSSKSAIKTLPFDLQVKNLSICGRSCVYIGSDKLKIKMAPANGVSVIPKGTPLKVIETSSAIGGPITYEADLSAELVTTPKPEQILPLPEDYHALKPPVYVVTRNNGGSIEFTNGMYINKLPDGYIRSDFPVNSHWVLTFNPRNGEVTSIEAFDPFPQDYKRRHRGIYPAPDPYLHERTIHGSPPCSPSSYQCF
jgi:hypothetical protein